MIMQHKRASVAKAKGGFDIVIDNIASDKSISHRCAIFSLLSDRPSVIKNYLLAEDTLNSLSIACKLGATASWHEDTVTITPPSSIIEPDDFLDCGNSGTTIRLMAGFLAAREGFFILTGDEYLRRRPMKRVADPLRSVGASIDGRQNGNLAPLAIRGRKLDGINYQSPISSAQVKSAMILAALAAKSESSISESELSRDHTERMLKGMGADIKVDREIKIAPLSSPLSPLALTVPSDPSSAFFFAVAAAITPQSRVRLVNLTLNPTRIEAFEVLKRMGAKVTFELKEDRYEPLGDIVVEHAPLKGVEVSENISWLIDELPALAIAMACANGKSVVKNAAELRVKESDRITSVVSNLQKCGIDAQELPDGFTIEGGTLKAADIDCFGDHRIAMSFCIAGLLCSMSVEKFESVYTSFPNFAELLGRITTIEVA